MKWRAKMDNENLRTLRQMAWQRAKGELQSMLCTFWDDRWQAKELDDEISKFIETIEGNGLNE